MSTFRLIFYFTTIFLMACDTRQASKENTDVSMQDSSAPGEGQNTVKQVTDTPADNYIPATEVVFDSSVVEILRFPGREQVTLSHPFKTIEALKAIFPGKEYRFQGGEENIDMVAWSCVSCDSVLLKDELEYEEAPVAFPGTAKWDTRALEKLTFQHHTKEYIILPFYTSFYEEDVFHTGRFNAPVVGLSLFVKENETWKSQGVNSALAVMGSFGTANQPELLHGGDVVLLSQKSSNGGAGGPFVGTRLIYAWSKGKWFIPLRLNASYCFVDGIFEWNTDMTVLEEKNEGMPALQSVMRGNVSDSYEYEWLTDLLPAKVKTAAAGKGEYSFVYTVTWEWKRGKYAEKSSQVTLDKFKLPEQ